MRSRTIVFVSLVVMLMLACGLATNTGGNPTNPGSVGVNTITPPPGPAALPTTPPNPVPVSLNDGLASLNSYDMTVKINSVGPDPSQSSTTSFQRQRSNDTNASSTSINMHSVSADGGEPSNTVTTIYQIGNDQCTGSDEDGWSWTSTKPTEAEMQGLIAGMFGLTPLINNPVFVAAETVDGIPTNHFTFKVSELGSNSGAVVNINQGDYWLAVDGQYFVKYTLIVETSLSADAEVLHEEFSIEMNQINQPVNIAFPQGCLDASLVTPTP